MPLKSNHITILCTKCKQLWQCPKKNVQNNRKTPCIQKNANSGMEHIPCSSVVASICTPGKNCNMTSMQTYSDTSL